eukprot:9160212-Lingulodinium_polyedra.AAC.1
MPRKSYEAGPCGARLVSPHLPGEPAGRGRRRVPDHSFQALYQVVLHVLPELELLHEKVLDVTGD